jgi:hypothetical protein
MWKVAVEAALQEPDGEKPFRDRLVFEERYWTEPTAWLIERLLEGDRPGWPLIRAYWRAAPSNAMERARAAYPDGRDAAHWFAEGASYRGDELLAVMAHHELAPPQWAVKWLARRMGSASGNNLVQLHRQWARTRATAGT